jgi:endogenous inhibitor of DNA gyrase (YacG/DUF329 family)
MIQVTCPICKRPMPGQGPTEWPDFPFCSARCRLIDLGRWLGEEYRVAADPGEEVPDPGDANESP